MADVPSGWYTDPELPGHIRYWDGERWTAHRQAASQPPPPPVAPAPAPLPVPPPAPASPQSVPSATAQRGLASARRLADRAKGSEFGRSVTRAAATGAHRAKDTLSDPDKRRTFLVTAYPMIDAAVDSAGVRNKKGEVKAWRVARAAVRPGKTAAAMSQAAAREAANRAVASASASLAAGPRRQMAPTADDIVAEWQPFDPDRDLPAWEEGRRRMELADLDDQVEMRACAALLCQGLKYAMSDPADVERLGELLIDTVALVLTAAVRGNDATSWGPEDERHARLALAVSRRFGLQSQDLGGDGTLDALFDEKGERMLMMAALSSEPWDFNLREWFAIDIP